MVRALATGDVTLPDWVKLLGRELVVALALGLSMALAVSVLGLLRGGPDVAVVVAVTMVLVVLVGSLVGHVPAVSSDTPPSGPGHRQRAPRDVHRRHHGRPALLLHRHLVHRGLNETQDPAHGPVGERGSRAHSGAHLASSLRPGARGHLWRGRSGARGRTSAGWVSGRGGSGGSSVRPTTPCGSCRAWKPRRPSPPFPSHCCSTSCGLPSPGVGPELPGAGSAGGGPGPAALGPGRRQPARGRGLGAIPHRGHGRTALSVGAACVAAFPTSEAALAADDARRPIVGLFGHVAPSLPGPVPAEDLRARAERSRFPIDHWLEPAHLPRLLIGPLPHVTAPPNREGRPVVEVLAPLSHIRRRELIGARFMDFRGRHFPEGPLASASAL
jgi:hypothetical protein